MQVNQSQLDVVKEELLNKLCFLSVVDPESTLSESLSTEPPKKKSKLSLGALTSLKKSEQPSPGLSSSPRDRLSKEIKTYLMYPVINGDEDPLKWWQRNRSNFPLLSQLARKYLCIQASSSPSERLFSKAGLISVPSRALLKPGTVDMLTFLAENL